MSLNISLVCRSGGREEYLKPLVADISALWSGIIIITFCFCINLASAKAYASLEFWFAMIKVITIILMIVLGFIVIFFCVGNGGKPTGFSKFMLYRWRQGFFFSMSIIVGSYEGIGRYFSCEVAHPQEAIVKVLSQFYFKF